MHYKKEKMTAETEGENENPWCLCRNKLGKDSLACDDAGVAGAGLERSMQWPDFL